MGMLASLISCLKGLARALVTYTERSFKVSLLKVYTFAYIYVWVGLCHVWSRKGDWIFLSTLVRLM